MGRRRNGRDVSGWLVVDKPAGPSSNAVVGAVRRAFEARKAGHSGTLDPLATGVLAIALGEATKTVPYIAEAPKTYRFTVRLGQATETDDAEGRVVAESAARPSDAGIEAALGAFRGDIRQVPPAYSAVKVDGRRAYAVARGGAAAELSPRPLHVARLDLVARPDADHAVLEMECGKGGYVRSIARDLGRALGCHGHVAELRRLRTGPFALDAALDLETVRALQDAPDRDRRLLPLETALADLDELPCAPVTADRLRHGMPGPVEGDAATGVPVWASCGGRAVAVGVVEGGLFRPGRVFAQAGAPADG